MFSAVRHKAEWLTRVTLPSSVVVVIFFLGQTPSSDPLEYGWARGFDADELTNYLLIFLPMDSSLCIDSRLIFLVQTSLGTAAR